MMALLLRDLRLAFRSGGGFGLALAFFLLVAVLVPLGVGPDGATLGRIAPGILWVGALLSCLLSLDRVFALDYEDGSLDLLAASPMPMEDVVGGHAGAVDHRGLWGGLGGGHQTRRAFTVLVGLAALRANLDIWGRSCAAGCLGHVGCDADGLAGSGYLGVVGHLALCGGCGNSDLPALKMS